MKLPIFAAGVLAASTGMAAAHDTTPIERELRLQAQTIDDGRKNGDLTWHEARELWDEQARIVGLLRQARSDGTVNRREFNAIRDAQSEARETISAELTDGDFSRWRRWYAKREERGYGSDYDRGGWGYGRWGYGYGRGDADRY
ncbi:MAG: hypothetical protein ACT4N2_15550 [Hyphomicrobium sp.]